MKKTILILLACLMPAFPSALSNLAATLKAGQWAELSTTGFTDNILENWINPNCHCLFDYTDDAAWDPSGEQLLFLGRGHGGTCVNYSGDSCDTRFLTYKAEANHWKSESIPSWAPTSVGHAYDHNAIDVQRGIFYHHPMNGEKIIYRYFIAQKRWTTAVLIPDNVATMDEIACCRGLEYFPEINSLVIINGKIPGAVYIVHMTTGKWTVLKNFPMGDVEVFSRYNPAFHCVLFGGGNYPMSQNLYRLDTNYRVTTLKNAPETPGMGHSIQTVDPVSGRFLFFFFESGNWYEYDLVRDTWTRMTRSFPFLNVGSNCANNNVFGTIATPVSNYGVNLFATYAKGNSKVFLYRHSEPSGAERDGHAAVAEGLSVHPNPVSRNGTLNVRVPAAMDEIALLNLHGQRLALQKRSGALDFAMTVKGLSRGVYLIKAQAKDRSLAKRLLVQ